MTIEQIALFYNEARKSEMQEMRLLATTIAMSVSAAVGGDKDGKFQKFLDMLGGEVKNINETLDRAQKSGLPIEDV